MFGPTIKTVVPWVRSNNYDSTSYNRQWSQGFVAKKVMGIQYLHSGLRGIAAGKRRDIHPFRATLQPVTFRLLQLSRPTGTFRTFEAG